MSRKEAVAERTRNDFNARTRLPDVITPGSIRGGSRGNEYEDQPVIADIRDSRRGGPPTGAADCCISSNRIIRCRRLLADAVTGASPGTTDPVKLTAAKL
jgi:hypothetical protein